jgi:hypothetical protein
MLTVRINDPIQSFFLCRLSKVGIRGLSRGFQGYNLISPLDIMSMTLADLFAAEQKLNELFELLKAALDHALLHG